MAAKATAIVGSRAWILSVAPSLRQPFSSPTFVVQFLLLIAATATAGVFATGDPLLVVAMHSCFCDETSLSSCECVCVGGGDGFNCYSLSPSKEETMNQNSALLRPRQFFGRRSRPTSWRKVQRGGGGVHEKSHVPAEQQQSKPGESSPPQRQQQQQQQQQQVAIPPSSLPLIDPKSASLALRLTCETNRRLRRGTSGRGAFRSRRNVAAAAAEPASHAAMQPHPSHQLHHQHQQQTVPSAIRSPTEEELTEERRKEELTVFHSMKPWEGPATGSDENSTAVDGEAINHETNNEKSAAAQTTNTLRTGILRWGPDLESFLGVLLSAVGLDAKRIPDKYASPLEDEVQVILAMTLLHLDHSTSLDGPPPHVDPYTGRPWFPPCPCLVPRTVHRMVLTALVVAAKCVRGYSDGVTDYSSVLRNAANSMLGDGRGVSAQELEQMEGWMVHALDGGAGMQHHQGNGWQVSQEEAGAFLRKWGATFYPSRLAAHDHSRMRQLESFWRHQASGFFGRTHGDHHGHGNTYWTSHDRSSGGAGADLHGATPLQYATHDGQWQQPGPQHLSHHHDARTQQQYYDAMGSEPF